MLCRGLSLVLICFATGSAAYGQEKPLLVPAAPHFPTNLSGLRIKLERTSCFGFCPDYSVTIYGDGTFVYEGHRLVKLKANRRDKYRSMPSVNWSIGSSRRTISR